jgi:hypothetical protein
MARNVARWKTRANANRNIATRTFAVLVPAGAASSQTLTEAADRILIYSDIDTSISVKPSASLADVPTARPAATNPGTLGPAGQDERRMQANVSEPFESEQAVTFWHFFNHGAADAVLRGTAGVSADPNS